MKQFVDVIVPRGGKGLIERIFQDRYVPVIKHLHVFVMFISMIKPILIRRSRLPSMPKLHRYGVCMPWRPTGAESIAAKVLPGLAEIYLEKGVELRGCLKTCSS